VKLGISSWSYPWAIGVPGYDRPEAPLDAFGLLDRAVALGVEVVQVADNLPVDALSTDDLARLAEGASRSGIAIELGTRGVEPAHLARYLELALATGARLVRTLTHRKDSTPDLPQIEAWLRQSLPSYERAGVTLALENYERHTAAELAALVYKIGSPSLGVCLDTVNSLGALETPAEVVCRLAPLTVNLHVKDFEIKRVPSMMGYVVTGCPAGTGRLDVPWLLDEMRGCGRDPSVIVEQWPPFSDTIGVTVALEAAWAEQSVRYLQTRMRG
jgi:sugar phosphate isomerase/epimerase